jgi:hypothetical protein
MQKGGLSENKTTLLISITIVLILIFITMIYFWKTTGKNPVATLIEKASEIVSGSENSNNNPSQNNPTNPGSGGGSGSSGGGGTGGGSSTSSGEEPSTGETSNCFTRQISYSLENVREEETCNLYEGEICLDKTIKCSIEVHNSDKEITGIFKMQLNFAQNGINLDTKIQNLTIGPSQFEIFEATTHLQSTGLEGQANKHTDCLFNTLEIPTKEVCY